MPFETYIIYINMMLLINSIVPLKLETLLILWTKLLMDTIMNNT